jgi:hypothetical protein
LAASPGELDSLVRVKPKLSDKDSPLGTLVPGWIPGSYLTKPILNKGIVSRRILRKALQSRLSTGTPKNKGTNGNYASWYGFSLKGFGLFAIVKVRTIKGNSKVY